MFRDVKEKGTKGFILRNGKILTVEGFKDIAKAREKNISLQLITADNVDDITDKIIEEYLNKSWKAGAKNLQEKLHTFLKSLQFLPLRG